MSLIAKASKGIQYRPQIYTIMGAPKIGKTTFAASFPDPIFADLEERSFHVDVTRLTRKEIPNFQSFNGVIAELRTSPHSFKSFVVDSVESLESLIHVEVCREYKVESVEDVGYGKGHTRVREMMKKVMESLQNLRDEKQMDIVLVAHTQVKNQTDPATNASFDRYIMRTNDKMASIIRDLSDNIFFATHKYFTSTDKNKKTTAIGDGERVIYTEWRPAFDAGNTLNLPFEIPLDYAEFKRILNDAKPVTAAEVVKGINEMLLMVKDKELSKKVSDSVKAAGADTTVLKAIKARVTEILKSETKS